MKKKSGKTLSWSLDTLSSLKRRIEEERVKQVTTTKTNLRSKPAKHPEEYSTNNDESLFLKAMSDVKEMPEFRALPHRSAKPDKQPTEPFEQAMHHSPKSHTDDDELLLVVSGNSRVDISQTDEYIQGYSPDVRPDLCEAMHAGQVPAQDSLDMHGLTLDEAKPALEAFIRQAGNRGLRCVNIIHGRGLRSPAGPVLKNAMRNWIDSGPLRKLVMAYATAPPSDGGPGATYLLLR